MATKPPAGVAQATGQLCLMPTCVLDIMRTFVTQLLVGDISCGGLDQVSNTDRNCVRLVVRIPKHILNKWFLRFDFGKAIMNRRLLEPLPVQRKANALWDLYGDAAYDMPWLESVAAAHIYLQRTFRRRHSADAPVSLRDVVAAMAEVVFGLRDTNFVDPLAVWNEFVAGDAVAPTLALNDNVQGLLQLISNTFAKNYPMYEYSSVDCTLRVLADEHVATRLRVHCLEVGVMASLLELAT